PKLSKDLLRERNYNKLLEITDINKQQRNNILYFKLKGLIKEELVNFKLSILSEKLTGNIIKKIVLYINQSHYVSNKSFERFLSSKEVTLINRLKEIDTRKGKTKHSLLLNKNKATFQLIQDIIDYHKVKLSENNKIAEMGNTVKPELKAIGNENEVKFELKEFKYPVISDRDSNIHWTVENGNKIHYIDFSIFDNLPGKVEIPENKKGEFLFEVLPALKNKFSLKIGSELNSYDLNKIEPEIKIKFDFIEEAVFCYPEVTILDENYNNTEILGFNYEENKYYKKNNDSKIWYGIDFDLMEKLIDFLEEYEFKVKPDGFYLKDKNRIQQLITSGLSGFPEQWEIETTADFDKIEVNKIELEPEIEIKDVEDEGSINWFEFTVTYNLGGNTYTRQELSEMISYNNEGNPYVEIDNKYFILQSGKREEKVDELIELADNGDEEKDNYRTKFYNILYYRNLIEEAGIKFKGNKVYNELEKDITRKNLIKEVPLPDRLEGVLRDYQKKGFYWLRFLNEYNFGGILADDMGLGKTLQILTLIKSIDLTRPAIVVCPRTLIYNWEEEVKKFFEDLDCLVYYGTPDEREEMISEFINNEIVVTSYSIISRDWQKFNEKNISFSYCILDEAQHIKNHKTKRSRAVKNIKSKKRLALTGTPLENSIKELWSIFDFLMKGYLGNFNFFRKNYLNPITKENDRQKLNKLKQRVAPFILRRKKEEVLQELPEKTTTIQTVNMTKLQEDSYRLILDEVKGKIMETVKEKGFDRSQINILSALTRLRQICDHPGLILGDKEKKWESGKMETLLELVEEGINSGHRLIVFSQFVKMLKLIRNKFEKKNIKFEYLDGSTRKRMEKVNRFNKKSKIKVFLISLKAGGTGLNLTGADMVIHVDPWWNPMVERQATDRTHRIGQKNRVIVYKLITKGTVEEKMLKLQKRKQNIFENVIENNKNPVKVLTWEDIQELLEY
ncbi:MAG: SNF2-related protein, partial [Halanaerobiaceae bacterium]